MHSPLTISHAPSRRSRIISAIFSPSKPWRSRAAIPHCGITAALRLVPFALSLFLLSACGPKATIQPITPSTVIMAFGDSLTAGVGTDQDHNYPAVLSRLLGHEIINEGISGETTSQGLDRLPDALDEYQPSLVILCMGGNDMLASTDHKDIRQNLATMIEMIRATGAEVILIGVPKPGLILGVPDFYEELANTYQLPYDDTLPSILSKNSLKSDYIHPNTQGYQIMAEAIHELIQDSEAR